MLGSVLVLMLPLLVWLTPDLRIKKSLLKCNWTIRKRLPRCKMRLKKRLLAFSRRLHARIRKTRYMHKMRCLLINRRSLLLEIGRASCREREIVSVDVEVYDECTNREYGYDIYEVVQSNMM